MGSLFNPLLNEFRVYKLMISLKLDANHLFFSLHDLEIRWMTSKNNRAPLLGCIELCALFQSRQWIQTELQSGKAQFGSKLAIFFVPCDLEIRRMTLQNKGAPLLWYKLCASFQPSINSNWSYDPDTPNLGVR